MSARSGAFARWRSVGSLPAIFACAILLPGGLLAALGVRALILERRAADVEAQHRLERAADAIGRAVEHELVAWQAAGARLEDPARFDPTLLPSSLRAGAAEPGVVTIASFGADGATVWPQRQLLYPIAPTAIPSSFPKPPSATLAAADAAELRDRNFEAAASQYEALLRSAAPPVRAGLLMRLARTYRKAGRPADALATYRALQRHNELVGALPADLIATYEICTFSVAPMNAARLAPCARDLYRDLVNGRWRIEPSRYLFYSAAARDWLTQSAPSDPALGAIGQIEARKMAVTELVSRLARSPTDVTSMRSTSSDLSLDATTTHLVLTWHEAASDGARLRTVAIARQWLDTHVWPPALAAVTQGEGVQVEVAAFDGEVLFRSNTSPARAAATNVLMASLPIADTGVPLRVRVWPDDPAALTASLARRQRYFVAVLGLVILVMASGAYFTTRVVRQELAIAQLKSDFVSAVSHEFRSPLTGIRQLGEMLLRGRVTSDERRHEYYARITSESDRLSRLVENLLDFSRMEAGRREYRMERLDVAPWLRGVAVEFQTRFLDGAPDIRVSVPATLPDVDADREALGCAVHNLLDNAVKYSPGHAAVWLDAEGDAQGVTIRVRDEGGGIAEEDRARIFDLFQRGTGDLTRRVKGAGLGLCLVRHIVAAHRGRVDCDSRLGQGATFVIRLPAARTTASA